MSPGSLSERQSLRPAPHLRSQICILEKSHWFRAQESLGSASLCLSSNSDGLKIRALPTPSWPCAPVTSWVGPVPCAGWLGSLRGCRISSGFCKGRQPRKILGHQALPRPSSCCGPHWAAWLLKSHPTPTPPLLQTCSLIQATLSPILGPGPSLELIPSRFAATFPSSGSASLC